MAITAFAMAIAQLAVPVVAFVLWRPLFDESPGLIGVFVLNAFWAALFFGAGMLFKQVRAGAVPAESSA